MQHPAIPSTAGQVTDDVLDSFYAKCRAFVDHERKYYSFFGPTFDGDYSKLPQEVLVFAYLQMSAGELRGMFTTTKGDYAQFLAIIDQATNPKKALELLEIAERAYTTAEARSKAHARFIQKVAADQGNQTIFADLAGFCSLDWAKADQVRIKHTRALEKAEDNGGEDTDSDADQDGESRAAEEPGTAD